MQLILLHQVTVIITMSIIITSYTPTVAAKNIKIKLKIL